MHTIAPNNLHRATDRHLPIVVARYLGHGIGKAGPTWRFLSTFASMSVGSCYLFLPLIAQNRLYPTLEAR